MENKGADQEPKTVPFWHTGAINMQYSVDVILLTYKPGEQVLELIRALEEQTYPIRKIIIMNTEERYFYKLFYGTGFLE
ncbi:MAG: hypothetical protein K2G55_12995, partial [Lachnospiraceae bacterium]|nr:hypothetical protein [Lachnospiraceae bacterium]